MWRHLVDNNTNIKVNIGMISNYVISDLVSCQCPSLDAVQQLQESVSAGQFWSIN